MTLQILILCVLVVAIVVSGVRKIFGDSGPYIVRRKGTDQWVELDGLDSKEDFRKIIDTLYK